MRTRFHLVFQMFLNRCRCWDIWIYVVTFCTRLWFICNWLLGPNNNKTTQYYSNIIEFHRFRLVTFPRHIFSEYGEVEIRNWTESLLKPYVSRYIGYKSERYNINSADENVNVSHLLQPVNTFLPPFLFPVCIISNKLALRSSHLRLIVLDCKFLLVSIYNVKNSSNVGR